MFRAKQVCCNQAVFVVVQSDSLALGRSLVFNHSSSTLRDRFGECCGDWTQRGRPGRCASKAPPTPPTPHDRGFPAFPCAQDRRPVCSVGAALSALSLLWGWMVTDCSALSHSSVSARPIS